jgi:hypothetical protein
LSRAAKPIVDEKAAAWERLEAAPDEWREWWQRRGERELRCILMTAWDPVGVGDVTEAWDEYDICLAEPLSDARQVADEDDAANRVAEYLHHVERDFMGLSRFAQRRSEHEPPAILARCPRRSSNSQPTIPIARCGSGMES